MNPGGMPARTRALAAVLVLLASAPRAEEGFHLRGEAPGALAGEPFEDVVEIEGDLRCSAVRISRTGHLLTAAHCLQSAFTRARLLRAGGLELRLHAAAATRYDAQISFYLGSRPARLLVAGQGTIPWWGAGEFNGGRDAVESVAAASTGDWAILRVEGAGPSPCRALAAENPRPGDEIWGAGYPSGWRVPRAHVDDGFRSAHGRVAASQEGNEWLSLLSPNTRRLWVEASDPLIASGDLLLTDADAAQGMSGGAAVDRSGRLVGMLVRSGCAAAESIYRRDSTQVIPVRSILAALRSAGLDPDEYFSCR